MGVILAVDPSPNGTAIVKLRKDVKSIAEPTIMNFWFCTTVKRTNKSYSGNSLLLKKVKRGDEVGRLNRMRIVHRWFKNLLAINDPCYVAFEDYIWVPMLRGKDKKVISQSTIQISEIGGSLRLAAMQLGIPFRTYEPGTVKIAWIGKGNASKDEMVQKTKEYLLDRDIDEKISNLPKNNLEDISDAIAVGWLLCQELMVREGTIMVRDLPKNLVRVFNRVTKATPMCLLDRPFVVSDG